jgi:predicted N-acetyltransferase YhbS
VTTPVVRPADPDDTPALTALLAEVFPANPKADPAVYAWNWWDHPLGPSAVVVAEAAGRVVGHAAVYAAPGRLGGVPVRLAHGGDAAVHPDHRGQGLFTTLARARAEAAAGLGAAATMVLPNPGAVGANVRAGLQVVGRVPAWVRPLDDGWVAARLHLPRAMARAAARTAFGRMADAGDAEAALAPPEDLDDLWARVASVRDANGLDRDGAWWRWRYSLRPGADYRFTVLRRAGHLVACAAVADRPALGTTFRYVFDLLATEAADARAVVAAALADAASDGAAGAVMLGMPGTWPATLAAACGFRRVPRRLEPRPMTLGIAGAPPGAAAQRWAVSWGDHDHV